MKTPAATIVCLSLACLGGCQSRPAVDIDAINASLQAERAKNAELTRRANDGAAAKAAAEKQVVELRTQLDAAQKQLTDERQNVEKLNRQLADSRKAKAAAEEQRLRALADNELLKAQLSQRGTLQTIDDAPPLDPMVPEEIRNAFRNALAWRADQIRSLEIEIRDTPSKAEAKSLRNQLEKLKSSPLAPPNLIPSDLTLGQIGPLQIDDHLRVDEVVDDTTLVVTPIKIDPPITPQSSAAGSTVVLEEANPIAIHGFPTKGAVTGAKITELPGLYYVEKTQRYGSRTIFVLAPVDANKLRAYFNRLQAELRAAAKPKPRDGDAAAK